MRPYAGKEISVFHKIPPEFVLCHFCTLQFKLKTLLELQDTMNKPYISESEEDHGVLKEKPIPLSSELFSGCEFICSHGIF